jgi:hypothetical protein
MDDKEALETIFMLAERNCPEYIKKIGKRKIYCHTWDDVVNLSTHLYTHELRDEKYLYIDIVHRKRGNVVTLKKLSKPKMKRLLADIERSSNSRV